MVKLLLAATALLAASNSVNADVYMHNPRGSNDRNCRTDNDQNRRNGNRLFDSQNNAKGGYSCPNARPFPCYRFLDDTQRTTCNQENEANPSADMLDSQGFIVNPKATRTQRMYYYEGSIVPVEWTNQHGCGNNPRMRCQIVLQYACEDTLTDNCDPANPAAKPCGPRDGFPVTNSLNTGNLERDAEATATIPDNNNNNEQSDFRYGRHETLDFYLKCKRRERNKGLFIADQNLNGNTAIYTRQNNNGNRNGLECPEESEYYPYWHPSPWKDIAYLTSDLKECDTVPSQSQNVMAKNECICPDCTGDIPNNERACIAAAGNWASVPAHGLAAPYCGPVDTTRENHLGNPFGTQTLGLASHYNWTIPANLLQAETCVLRLRYNVSTIDYDSVSVVGDAKFNTKIFTPIKDRTNSEPAAYKEFSDITDDAVRTHAKLGLAMNTNQYGRVFQDRSYTFAIKKQPTQGECAGKKIYNLNVRGKRGNIVQTYPSVEYDFVPNHLEITEADCIHVQWTGSDYNPDQNPNNAYGGPSSPLNLNEAKSDRHNLVQVKEVGENAPVKSLAEFDMFAIDMERKLQFAFIGQDINNPQVCMNITEIKLQFPTLNQDARDRLHYNCGKLSGALTPYFDGGLVRPSRIGDFNFMSTRDNSFTNRDMKGTIVVRPGLSEGGTIGLIVGGVALVGMAAGLFLYRRKQRQTPASTLPTTSKTADSSSNSTKGGFFSKFGGGAAAAGAGAAASSSVSQKHTEEKALPPPKEKKAATPVVVKTASAAPLNKTASTTSAAAPKAAAAAVPIASSAGKSTCTALYAHDASEPGELSFKKGDKITVLKKDPSGWWEGSLGNSRGLFPANYVKDE